MGAGLLLPNPIRPAVHVRETLAGWWAVTFEDGAHVRHVAQYTSEFQAREAGRVNAVRLEADLVIHQGTGPTILQAFDAAAGVLGPPTFSPPA